VWYQSLQLKSRGLWSDVRPPSGAGAACDDMAASDLEPINAVQPRGDIRLIGLIGRWLALEVATRLIAPGRSIKFLGILAARSQKCAPRIKAAGSSSLALAAP
jgi:thioesterase domain-containing protein